MLITPAEHYQSYTLIVEDAIFNVLEIELLLRYAATYLLIGSPNLDSNQIEKLVSAKLKNTVKIECNLPLSKPNKHM
jgi:hypothetical protein